MVARRSGRVQSLSGINMTLVAACGCWKVNFGSDEKVPASSSTAQARGSFSRHTRRASRKASHAALARTLAPQGSRSAALRARCKRCKATDVVQQEAHV